MTPGVYSSQNTALYHNGQVRALKDEISQGCIVLMTDCNEAQELREQLYQAKQVVKGIKDVLV